MAELLVYNTVHWWDKLTQTEKDKMNLEKKKVDQLNGCYKKGDVIEVREDGYFVTHGYRKDVFCVVKVPNESSEKFHYLLEEDDENKTRRKMKLDYVNLTDSITTLKDIKTTTER